MHRIKTQDSIELSYELFNGTEEHEIQVKEGEIKELEVEILSEGGSSIDLTIASSGNKAYAGKDIATSNFTVKLEKAGDYTIKINCKNHKRSIKINY